MSKQRTISQLAKQLRPYLAEYAGGGSGGGVVASSGGVSDHGLLSGLAGDDHPQYLTSTRGNALYIQLGDAPALQSHALDDGDYHTASGLTVGDVLAADSSTAFSWRPLLLSEITATGGEGITLDGNDISVDVGDGLALSAQEVVVNEAFAFDWLGEHTFADDIGGDADEWQITAEGNAEFADIQADSLTVDVFIADVNLAIAGSEYITPGGATLSRDFTTPATTGTLYVWENPGLAGTDVFASGDTIRLRYVDQSAGLVVGWVAGTVGAGSAFTDGEQSYTFTRTEGGAGHVIRKGMWALDFGTSGSGYILSTALGDDTPYIDIGTWATTTDNQTTQVRLGNLDGISDATLSPSGYGLYSDNVYMHGELVAAGGDVAITDAGGISIEATTSASVSTTKSLQFRTDATATSDATLVTSLVGSRIVDGDTNDFTWLHTEYGAGSGADEAKIWIDTYHAGGSSSGGFAGARLALYSEDVQAGYSTAVPAIELLATSDTDVVGNIHLFGNTIIHEDVYPNVGSSKNIGSAALPFAELHVDTLFAGTTSSTDTGHSHNDLYYTESETDALLAAKSASSHTHSGYATDANLLAHTTNADLHREIDDAGTGATDLWSANKIGTAIAAGVSGLATTSTLLTHTTNADKHREIDDAGAATTDLWSANKIGTLVTSDIATHAADDDAHHDPVTVGSNLTLAGQAIGLGADVALLDVGATFADDVEVEGTFTVGNFEINQAGQITTTGTKAFSTLPRQGLLITDDGDVYANNADFAGAFNAGVFTYNSTVVHSGNQIMPPGGGAKLKEPLDYDAVTTTFCTIHVEDAPALGHVPQFGVGYRLQLKGPAEMSIAAGTGGMYEPWNLGSIMFAASTVMASKDLWLEVTAVTDQTTHYSYTCDIKSGDGAATFYAGSAVASYRKADEGDLSMISLNVTDANMPGIVLAKVGEEPWDGDISPTVAIGELSGWAGITEEQGGIMVSTDLNDDSDTIARLVASDAQMYMQNIPITMQDANGESLTLDPDNGLTLYSGIEDKNFVTIAHDTEAWLRMGIGSPNPGAWGDEEIGTTIIAPWHTPAAQVPFLIKDGEDGDEFTIAQAPVAAGARLYIGTETEGDVPGTSIQLQSDDEYNSITLRGDSTWINTRSTHISASGSSQFQVSDQAYFWGLPTSATGLATGAIWNDSGTLKIA